MTRQDLRELVLYWLDDLQGGYFTETQVNTWLNNAQKEVQKQLLDCGEYWYLKCVFADTVADEGCYSLPADFLKCNKFEVRVGGTSAPNEVWSQLVVASLGEASAYNYGTAQPGFFTIAKDCFYLWPTPDQAYRIHLYYSYAVSPMTDDLNVPDVPDQYQEYVAVVAAIDGFLKDQRDPSPMYAKRDMYLEMMKKDQIQRNRAQPRRVIRTFNEGWLGF